MTFKDYKYERPDLALVKGQYEEKIGAFKTATDAQTQIDLVKAVFKLMDEVDTMGQLVSIRYSLNTQDEFYEQEMNYIDEISPELQNFVNEFQKAVIASPFREALVNVYGQHFFDQMAVSLESFDEKIIPFMVEENKLASKYSKLLAAAQIEFDGGTYNLSQMSPFAQSKDRDTRHKAQLAVSNFFQSIEKELDETYDKLVQVRDQQAKTLGYESYVELGYKRLGRTDYGQKEVKAYREQIKR
ncbi:MAG: M3 family oligoendopeptidase, partial [Tenericutes bacterium HGW-Tenericutes-8]